MEKIATLVVITPKVTIFSMENSIHLWISSTSKDLELYIIEVNI